MTCYISTYVDVLCEGCDAELGRIYKTTSRKLDYARDLFTLFTQNLKRYITIIRLITFLSCLLPLMALVSLFSYTVGSSGIAVATDDEPKTPIADSATPVEASASAPPSISTEAVMETLSAEKLKLQQAIDEQKKMLEEQAEALKAQAETFSKFKEENGARMEKRDAQVAVEFDVIKNKITEIDESMAKVKALWVHFDQRVKMLETFSSGLLSQLGLEGQESTPAGMDVDMVGITPDSTGGNVSDGSNGKRSKRKR